jgi:hypothetical protein
MQQYEYGVLGGWGVILTEEHRGTARKICPSATVANMTARVRTFIFSYLNAVLGNLSKTNMIAYSNR